MKLRYIQSSTVMIEDTNTKILCDPWFVDGEYYGSWAHYPPYDYQPEKFKNIDYIYISHIHPDHLSHNSMKLLDKSIPVLIHEFPMKYLKTNIESMGFKVTELPHNTRTYLKNGLHINILAADNCDPSICGKLFACNFDKTQYGTNQIDTMSIIDNGYQVIVNTNDCPFEIAAKTSQIVKDNYKKIDLLLVGYSGASSYPHCYDLPEEEKNREAERKKNLRLSDAKKYIELFDPKYYLPFAGRYTLVGKLSKLNDNRGEPELEEAFDYLSKEINQDKNKGILLNPNSYFDITNNHISDPYKRINPEEKKRYINDILSSRKFDYENKPEVTKKDILKLVPRSYARFETQRNKLNFESNTDILLDVSNDEYLRVSCKGSGCVLMPKSNENKLKKYVTISLDKRLLKDILEGPKKAHWNNADIGSHIKWKRVPNVYERGIYHCLNFFHS